MKSPGVEVKEYDFSDYVQSINSIAVGCVGEAKRGPLEPTLVTSQEELINMFGEPIEGCFGIYGAYQALTIVDQLFYQRVVGQGAKAIAGVSGEDAILYEMKDAGAEFNGFQIQQVFIPANEDDPETEEDESSDGIYQIKVLDEGGEVLEATTEVHTLDNLVDAINTELELITATKFKVEGTFEPKTLEFEGGVDGASTAKAGSATQSKYLLESKYPDSDINGARLVIGEKDNFGYYNVILYSAEGKSIESFLSLDDDPDDERYIITAINNMSKRFTIKLNDIENPAEDYEYVFEGGKDGANSITSYDIIGKAEDGSGMQSFSNPETVEINLMMIPGNTDPGVNAAAVTLCENRGDVLYIADTPKGLSAQEAANYANGEGAYESGYIFNSSYAAIYYPWVEVADPYTKKNILLPPSGAVVAQLAYSDSVSHPWFAPAGLNRGIMQNIVNLEKSPSKGERDVLYGNRNCVNPIVKFTGTGIVIWGQKTTQRKCSALDRVNVRRLLNYLKKVIGAASRYYLFEPNDPITWNKWIDMVDSKLNTVKTQRGINDMKVVMHPTANQIDNYEMPGKIMIKPTKTAEYMELAFMIMSTGATFDETLV